MSRRCDYFFFFLDVWFGLGCSHSSRHCFCYYGGCGGRRRQRGKGEADEEVAGKKKISYAGYFSFLFLFFLDNDDDVFD
jgi:hypothetical protein